MMLAISLVFPLKDTGLPTRLLFSTLTVIAAVTILGFITWAVHIPLTVRFVTVLLTIGTLFALSVKPTFFATIYNRHVWLQSHEIIFLSFTLLIISIPAYPLITRHDAPSIVSALTLTDDNITHLAIVKAITNHHSYLEGIRDPGSELEANDTAYPQGWHLSVALGLESLTTKPSPPSNYSLLLGYYLLSIAWLGIFAYTAAALIWLIASRVLHSTHINIFFTVALFGVVGKLFVSLIFPLFAWGDLPQLASFSLLLVGLYCLVLASDTPRKISNAYILLALFYCVGLSFCYYFLTPVCLASFALYILILHGMSIRNLIRNYHFLLAVISLTVISLIPIALYLLYFRGATSSKLNETGGTLPFNINLIVLFALLSLALSFYTRRKVYLLVGLSTVVACCFASAILIYQLHTAGAAAYYFYKAADTVVVLATIALAIGIVIILRKLFPIDRGKLASYSACALFFIAGLLFTQMDKPYLFTIYTSRTGYGLSQNLSAAVLKAAQEAPGASVVSFGSCANYTDARATRMVEAISGRSSKQLQAIVLLESYPQNGESIVYALNKYAATMPNTRLTILTSDPAIHSQLMQKLSLPANYINTSSPTMRASSCTEQLRP